MHISVLTFQLLILSKIIASTGFKPVDAYPNKTLFQEDTITVHEIDKKFNNALETKQEKVYIHFDKHAYVPGETIYFKCYITNSWNHRLISYPTSLFVDLVYGDSVISNRKLRVMGGVASGQFQVENNYFSGQYFVRAFTPWMMNFSSEYFFRNPLEIYNPLQTVNVQPVETLDLQFFPEGGHLLGNVISQVGFKCTGSNGRGRKVNGWIEDSYEKEIATFESNHLGHGSFFFKPEVGKIYKAKIKDHDKVYPLPEVFSTGYSCIFRHIGAEDIVAFVNVKGSSQGESYSLIGQTRGVIYYGGVSQVANETMVFRVPKEKFPEGVVQFTLFNRFGQSLLERLVYVNESEHDNSYDTLTNQNIAPRKKQNFRIDLSRDLVVGNQLDTADLSISITDFGILKRASYIQNVKTYMLLQSDLTGLIESPGYYFDQIDRIKQKDLDYLMLTQGWRRYQWSSILEEESFRPEYYPDYASVILGTVLKRNSKPFVNEPVNLLVNGNLLKLNTDQNGEIRISADFFYASDSIMLLAEGKSSTNTELLVDFKEDTLPEIEKGRYYYGLSESIPLSNSLVEKFLDMYSTFDDPILLDPLIVKEESKVRNSANASLYGDPDYELKLDDRLRNYNDIFALLRTRLPGLRIVGSGGQEQIQIVGVGSFDGPSSPLIMLDGRILHNPTSTGTVSDALGLININNIDRIELVKGIGTSNFGRQGANGVILFYSRQGKNYFESSKDINFNRVPGYHKPIEFNHPSYQSSTQSEPDRRVTLYWNPTASSDENGILEFSFHNNESATKFEVVVEGITASGKPIFHHAIIE